MATAITEVEGVAWCVAHDDIAMEGYDWSDVCRTAYVDDLDPDDSPCDLRPLFVQS